MQNFTNWLLGNGTESVFECEEADFTDIIQQFTSEYGISGIIDVSNDNVMGI